MKIEIAPGRFFNRKIHMKFFQKIITFLKEVRLEMKKVNWPTKQETLRYTLIVIAASVAVAVFLGGLDYLFSYLLDKLVI